MAAASLEDGAAAARDSEVCAALIERVRRAIERAQAIPIVAAEELSGDDLLPIREQVLASIDDTSRLLGDILDHYDRDLEDEEAFDFDDFGGAMVGEVERRMDTEGGATKITSVAFVARIGLRNRRGSLVALRVDPKWEIIASCSSAVREILKSLSAVELAIADHEGFPPTSRYYVSELERALQIRRAYFTFRGEVVGRAAPETKDAARRLRVAASAIAKLTGRAAYPYSRVHDRSNLRQLQMRIRELLTSHARAVADPTHEPRVSALDVAAVRLHQDLVNLAELFMLINNRAELREHDRVRLSAAVSDLANGADAASICAALDGLLGRDAELDEVLLGRSEPARGELATMLQRCLDALVRVCDDDARADAPTGRRRATDAPHRTEGTNPC